MPDERRSVEQNRKAAVKTALALVVIAVLFYIGFIVSHL